MRFAATSISVQISSAKGIRCSRPSSLSMTRRSVPPVRSKRVTMPELLPIARHHFRAYQLMLKELALFDGLQIIVGDHHLTPDQLFGRRHRVVAFKLQNHATLMKPVVFNIKIEGASVRHSQFRGTQ